MALGAGGVMYYLASQIWDNLPGSAPDKSLNGSLCLIAIVASPAAPAGPEARLELTLSYLSSSAAWYLVQGRGE